MPLYINKYILIDFRVDLGLDLLFNLLIVLQIDLSFDIVIRVSIDDQFTGYKLKFNLSRYLVLDSNHIIASIRYISSPSSVNF